MATAPVATLIRAPPRAMEIVHRDLKSSVRFGRSAGTSLLSSEAASRSDGSRKSKSAKGSSESSKGSKPKVPDLISHWAVRIEREPGLGREDDPTTWGYFGLVSPNLKSCELNRDVFVSDDRPERRFRGYTLWSPEDYEPTNEANMLIAAAKQRGYGPRNNCQDFAVTFFLVMCHQADSADEMTKLISKNSFFRTLLTIKEEDDVVFENGGVLARFKRVRARDGSIVLEYRLGQNACVYFRSN